MWITESTGNKIARVTPKGVVSEFPIPTPNSHPSAITLAGDGNLWFTEGNGNKIGSVTPAGVVADYPLTSAGASPSAIAAKGALLAFSEPGVNKIGYAYVDEPGSIFEDPVPTPGSSPQAITLGADGAFWFVEYLGNRVARAVFGAIVEYPIPTSASHPRSITATNDGELLFTEQSGGKSGRVQLHPLGDVNGDGSVGVGDVFYLIDFLFAGGPEPK
jgi:virginiamycin B lyase